ncbi:MAG: hypothetical protein JWM66_1602 [Solirubrobacterales bacterium]|nr:hypothetical protein [Solirubrobacterales bacterium]
MVEGMRQAAGRAAHRRLARARPRRAMLASAATAAILCSLVAPGSVGAALASPSNDLPPEVVGSPLVGERLVCGSGSWSGFVSGFTYEWLRDGLEFTTGVAYTVTTSDKGHSLWCVVTAIGGTPPYPKATSSNSIAIPGGSPATRPHNESPPHVSGQPTVGSTLGCSPGTWSASPPPTISYQWVRDEQPVAGETGSSHKVVAEDVGHSLSCQVTAANSAGSETVRSSPVSVPAVRPVNISLPQVLGAAPLDPGDAATCRPGEWTETPRPTFAYSWVRDRGLPGEAIIEGATSSGYTVEPADELHTLSCRVTATNAAGSTEAASGNVLKVRGTPPQNAGPPFVEGAPSVGDTLTCNVGLWTGVPAPTYGFAWVRDRGSSGEQTVVAATTSEYLVGSEDRGHSLSCAVSAKNIEGSASQVSGPVVVAAEVPGHEAPLELTAPAVAGAPQLGAALSCSGATWSGNPTPVISYQWLRDGSLIAAAASSEYVVVAGDQGHVLSCRVTALNEEGVASASSANALEIPGVAPEDLQAPVVTGSPTVGSPLTCTRGVWNGSPAPSFTYQWLRAGTIIPSATAQTYVVGREDSGRSISCRVTAKNSAGSAQAVSANSVEVPGREPYNTGAPVVTGVPAVGQTLTCSPGTWSGQPTPSFSYRWLLNAVAIPEATASTLVVTSAAPGFDVSCEVTAGNREGSSAETSAPLHIPGAAPQAVERPSVSGAATVGAQLTCQRGVWTAKPPPAFAYRWLRDGTTIAGSTNATYAVALVDQGHVLSCRVTAVNVEGTAEAESGNMVAIARALVRGESGPPESAFSAVDNPLPPPSRAQILASLAAQLAHAQKRARVSFVRRSGLYGFSFTALAAGRLEVSWYQLVKDPLHRTTASKTVVLAQATVSFAGPATKIVKLRLTSAGRSAFSAGKLVKLFAKGAFVPPHARGLTWVAPVTLSH